MKKNIVLIFLIGIGCISIAQETPKNIDFSAVEQHFIIMDLLLSGQEPATKQWDELFNTPAYEELISREFRNPIRFQEVLRAAYLPGCSKSIEDILLKIDRKGNWWTAWVTSLLAAYENIPNQKNELIELMKEYKNLEYTDFTIKEVSRFLPDQQFENFPQIAFIIFNDSRGYDPIILSLNSFINTMDDRDNKALDCMISKGFEKNYSFQLLYAHEAFHYYRKKKEEFKYPENNDPYNSLIWIMNQIENEGIADQIDKQNQYFYPGCFADTKEGEKYLSYLAIQPNLIQRMDSIFAEILIQPDSAKVFSRKFSRMIPRSGHQTGFYMCNAIIEVFGEKSLIPIVRNPFGFFKLYQKAALKNDIYPSFSQNAMSCIEMLERRFKL